MNPGDFYESGRALAEYLLFHYGTPAEQMPWDFGPAEALEYPARCVRECLDPSCLPAVSRALDLGCAVGRSAFELARHCTEVIGIDYSHQFIDVAGQLQRDGEYPYAHAVEGRLTVAAKAVVPAGIDRRRVAFEQGDAMALRADLGTFDVVLLANLLDRLTDPAACLRALPRVVRPGGQLIITTPCTWLEEYAPASRWLGGFEEEGRAVRTLDSLDAFLGPDFDRTRTLDMPFLIREHERKFQWSVAQASVWRRK